MAGWWDSTQLDELFNKFCSAQIKSRVMLDARLTYSCGYWKEAKTLDQAQEHNFGPDYDKTLMCWFENLSENWEKIKDNYDDQFFLMWKYLTQDGVCNPVLNVLTLPLSLNHTKNSADWVTYPVRV